MNKPRFYRPSKGNHISWEVWRWDYFFLTLSVARFEIQINQWPKQLPKCGHGYIADGVACCHGCYMPGN